METVNTVSLLATVCDSKLSFPSVLFAVLPECSSSPRQAALSCSLSEREVLVKSYPIQSVIQLSTDFGTTKKAGTSRWYVPTENSQTSPLFMKKGNHIQM